MYVYVMNSELTLEHVCVDSYKLALLPGSHALGTWTLKLCRHGESSVFVMWKAFKGREEIERPQLCMGILKDSDKKKTKVAGNLLHVSGCRGSNIIQIRCWTHGWTMRKMLPFCSKHAILMTSWSCKKRYQALCASHVHIPEKPAWEWGYL